MTEKWCYKFNETYPLTEQYWYYTDKTHKRFKNVCRKCANCESKLSHQIHRSKKDLQKK